LHPGWAPLRFALLALGTAVVLDALLLESGRPGLLSAAPRRLALDGVLAALLFLAAQLLRHGARALLRPAGAFLVALALFCANTRPLWSGDTEAAVLLPYALIRHQTFALDEVACRGPQAPPMYAAVPGERGRLWSRYPILTGLLALPLELPAALGHADPCAPLGRDIEKVSAALLGALIAALLSSALRALVPELPAALALLCWLLGTAALPVLGQALWQHTGAALGAALAVRALCLPQARGQRVGLRAAMVGLGAGLVAACRPPDLPIALALFWAFARLEKHDQPAARDRRANALRALLAAALPLAIHIAYQWHAFGGPLRTGYGDEAIHGWSLAGFPLALAGLLVSPGRGLLVWSPILLVALLPLVRAQPAPPASDPRAREHASNAAHFSYALFPFALGLAAQLLLIACWWAWHGGSSFGPRMHAGGLPLHAPLLALAFAQLRTPRAKLAAALLALASIVPNALVTYVPFPRERTEAILHLRAPGGAWSGRAYPL